MWTAVLDKNISMIDPINKAVLGVKSSDNSLCGGESHLRVITTDAASDSTERGIGASVETAIVAVILAPALTMWTTVNELATSIRAKINTPNNPILGVKCSDTSLCGGVSLLRVNTTDATIGSAKAAVRTTAEIS